MKGFFLNSKWGVSAVVGILLFTCVGRVVSQDRPPVPRPPKLVQRPDKTKPWPFAKVGLRFQRSGRHTQFKPMGDAGLAPDGRVVFTFPTIDTVVSAATGDFTLSFMGPTQHGGNGQRMPGGDRVFFRGSQMILADEAGRRLNLFGEAGFQHAVTFKSAVFLPGPDGDFLVGEGPLFYRVDARHRTKRTFRLGGAVKPLLQVLPNWDVVAWNDKSRRLQHWNGMGYHLGEIQLTMPVNCKSRVVDMRVIGDTYWMLVRQGAKTLLWVIDQKGVTRGFWETPFAADGLDVSADHLLLFTRASGAAEVYGRN